MLERLCFISRDTGGKEKVSMTGKSGGITDKKGTKR